MRLYAIGDIHGHLAKLVDAHREVLADRERTGDGDALVIHLGDLVDRGPDSRGVIDYMMHGVETGAPWRVIKGNHDRMFTDFVRHAREDDRLWADLHWLHDRLGGAATLASYGVVPKLLEKKVTLAKRAAAAVPEAHLRFLEDLPLFHRTDEVFLVHAGIKPGVPLGEQSEDDLLWIREEFLDDGTDHGHLVVHGHTPVEAPEHRGNRVALDTGAAFGGPLTVAVFEGRDVWVLRDGQRYPLLPGEAFSQRAGSA
ncbi:MAG: metallophosphoesterase family protein [Pseudomonadota bacterium]